MMTRRLLGRAIAVSLFTLAGFGSCLWAQPAIEAPVDKDDLKHLQTEVQRLKEELAQLKNQPAGVTAVRIQTGSPSEADGSSYVDLKRFGAKGDGLLAYRAGHLERRSRPRHPDGR